MIVLDIEDLLTFWSEIRLSEHALREAHKEGLRAKDVFQAILKGEVIECYPRRHRVLITGPTSISNLPLHVVCDTHDRDEIVVVTTYVPDRRRWSGRRTRRGVAKWQGHWQVV